MPRWAIADRWMGYRRIGLVQRDRFHGELAARDYAVAATNSAANTWENYSGNRNTWPWISEGWCVLLHSGGGGSVQLSGCR